MKTRDTKAPIKVYDLKGNKLTQYGGGIDGLSGDGGISIDSNRDLYLAACDGHLTTVTMDGQRKDRIDMEGCELSGVTYIRGNDLYAVSDVTEHKISLIDPRTKSMVRSFGSKGKVLVSLMNHATSLHTQTRENRSLWSVINKTTEYSF